MSSGNDIELRDDLTSWNARPGFEILPQEFPGLIVKLATVEYDCWAACRVVRKWWQPWLPLERIVWIKVDMP